MGSWSDWDKSGNVSLTTDTYVSAPSSLKIKSTGYAFLKSNVVNDDLSEGQVIFWIKVHSVGADETSFVTFVFRHQGDLSNESDEFKVQFRDEGGLQRIIVKTGSGNVLKEITYTFGSDWQKFRVTWWVSEGHLIIRVEHYTGGQWVKKIEVATGNSLSDGGRVGFRGYNNKSKSVYIDDFSLYVA